VTCAAADLAELTRPFCWLRLSALVALAAGAVWGAEFRGQVLDADSARPIAARVYLQNAAREWLFVSSANTNGTALQYREEWVPMPGCVERHTTVSADPFHAELPQGGYTIEIERGKEFIPLRAHFAMADAPVERTFRLRQWINLAQRG
jgi:hypothetical protein